VEGRCEEAVFLRWDLTLNRQGLLVLVVVVVVGRCCCRSPVLWEQGVGWAFSRGGAKLRSQFPLKEARAQEGAQVRPVELVGEPRFLTSSAAVTVAPGALEMELATMVFSSVETFVEGQPNLISASLDRSRTILGNSELRMLSKC